MFKVFCFVHLLLLSLLGTAQVWASESFSDHSKQLSRLSPNEGLSQVSVTKTVQDNRGFIWIATELGLNRYDGYQIMQVKGPNDVFAQEYIAELHVDNKGNVWVGTGYSGLYVIDPVTLEATQVLDGKLNGQSETFLETSLIYQTDAKSLWIGMSHRFFRFNISDRSFTPVLTLENINEIIRDVIHDGDTMYIATSSGLYRYLINDNQLTPLPHLGNNPKNLDSKNTKSLRLVPNKGLYVGTVEGLYLLSEAYLSGDELQLPSLVVPSYNIWEIIEKESCLLLATNKGLYKLGKDNHKLEFILNYSNSRFIAHDNNITDLFIDRSGNIWLASRSLGALKWSPTASKFQHITNSTNPGLSHDNVWTLFNDSQQKLWIGTQNGLNLYQPEQNSIQHFLKTNDEKAIYGRQQIYNIFPFKGDDNRLWIVNDDGLFIFDKSTNSLIEPAMQPEAEEVMKKGWKGGYLVLDNLAYFIHENGHYRYDGDTGVLEALADLDDQFPVELSHGFLGRLPGSNNLLLATSGHLYSYNPQSKISTLLYKVKNYDPASFDAVDNWALDKNMLWLAVMGEGIIGVDLTDNTVKYQYDTTNKLATNNVYSVQTDGLGNLWFSSQAGLYRLNLSSHHIENFTAEDGLLSNEFNGNAYAIMPNGMLAYGSPSGITQFNPADFIQRQIENDFLVQLSSVSMMSENSEALRNLTFGKPTVLNHDDYGLDIAFSTLTFVKQNRTLYNISLTGPENFHYPQHASNHIMLPKLSPGDYQLQISALDPVTGQESKALIFKIKTLHAPFTSPLAKSLLALLLMAAILAFYLYKEKQRKALLAAHHKTLESETQMQLALKGSNSGIWQLQVEQDNFYDQRMNQDLGYGENEQISSLRRHLELVHPQDKLTVKKIFSKTISGLLPQWEMTYRMKTIDGNWQWYKCVGQVVSHNDKGEPELLSGIYTNISETKANQEQSALFGKAFSQINDWVLILNESLVPVSANAAFVHAFALDKEDKLPTARAFLTRLGEQKYAEFNEIISSLPPGKNWQSEEVITTAHKEKHPVLIKINAIAGEHGAVGHYVIVLSDITMQKHAEEKLRYLAHYDYLTELPNRSLILDKLNEAILSQQQDARKMALLFLDLDKFKQVNDSLGHAAGDLLLKTIARKLVGLVNSQNVVARQSGDEFMILADRFHHIDDLSHLCEKINHALCQPIQINTSFVQVSSSIGIAIFPDDAEQASELIRKADLAMIHAKRQGPGNFQFFTQEMNDMAHRRLKLENELRVAVEQQALTNFYQPIIDSHSFELLGVELLLRWQHQGSHISPGEFIPIAEENGLITKITEQAIEQALQDFCQWRDKLPQGYVSVNLSAVHIMQEGLCQLLLTLLEKYQLPVSSLRLEITEGSLLIDKQTAMSRLLELSKQGFVLLLDDFGTGYSSLTYLSQFPIDIIKIDRSFVINLENNPVNQSIINSIMALADNLKLSTVAEGVETETQLNFIKQAGCNFIQGYYFAKPMDIDNLSVFINSHTQSNKNARVSH